MWKFLKTSLLCVLLFTWVAPTASEGWSVDHDIVYSVCPDEELCYCYNTGESDVFASCRDSKMDSIPTGLPVNITSLDISTTSITALPTDSFSNYTNLKELFINYNHIYSVEDGVLNGLSLLEKLHLEDNNITALPDNMFNPCPELTEVHLAGNALTTFPTLPSLQKLTNLDLSKNALTSLTSGSFLSAPNLLQLDLHDNDISTIDSNAFEGLQKLVELDLSDNEISTLPQTVFNPLQSTSDMDLSSNLLESLSRDQFAGPGDALIRLNLNYNRMKDVNIDAFRNLQELDELYMNNNQLTDVPEALKSLPKLDYLSLAANPFATIKARAFEGIEELNEVTLSDMPTLLDLHVDAFAANRMIQLIRLTNNPNLTSFTPQHLPDADHPILRVLFLSGNGFTYMDEALFATKDVLERVDLQNNPFHCDCKLQWISQVVRDGVNWARHWTQTGSAPRCGTPGHIEGFMMSTMLPQDLSCEDVVMSAVTEDPLVVHLHSPARIEVKLENGLPASKWRTPSGEEYFPLRTPPYALVDTVLGTRVLKESQRPLVTEYYTAEHQVIAVLEYSNATANVAGSYRVTGQNGNGERFMDVSLEVLPYEATLPPPTVGAASLVTSRLMTVVGSLMMVLVCLGA